MLTYVIKAREARNMSEREIGIYVNENFCNGLNPCRFLRGNNSKGTCQLFGQLKAEGHKILPSEDCINSTVEEQTL